MADVGVMPQLKKKGQGKGRKEKKETWRRQRLRREKEFSKTVINLREKLWYIESKRTRYYQ